MTDKTSESIRGGLKAVRSWAEHLYAELPPRILGDIDAAGWRALTARLDSGQVTCRDFWDCCTDCGGIHRGIVKLLAFGDTLTPSERQRVTQFHEAVTRLHLCCHEAATADPEPEA